MCISASRVFSDPRAGVYAEPHALLSFTPSLTCQVFGTGSEWRTGEATRLCYQAPASTAACNDAQQPQNRLTDTPGVRVQPTLGRKAYVWSVLEHHHSPREGRGNNMLDMMKEKKSRQMKAINKRWHRKTVQLSRPFLITGNIAKFVFFYLYTYEGAVFAFEIHVLRVQQCTCE